MQTQLVQTLPPCPNINPPIPGGTFDVAWTFFLSCVSAELDTAYSFDDNFDKIWLSIPTTEILFGSDAELLDSKEASASFSRIIFVVEDNNEPQVDTISLDVLVSDVVLTTPG